MSLVGIPSKEARKLWPRVRPLLKRATDRASSAHAVDDLLEAIEDQRMQLWVVWNGDYQAVGVTQICIYPKHKVLQMLYLGGSDLRDWFHVERDLVEFARSEGCDCIEMHGRKGWAKVLPGYEETHVILRKVL